MQAHRLGVLHRNLAKPTDPEMAIHSPGFASVSLMPL
jgi:hypothetical protein